MAFRERLAWISLAAVGGGFLAYLYLVLTIGTRAGWAAPVWAIVGPLVLMGLIVAIVAAIGAAIAAIHAPRDANAPEDERDRSIGRSASAGAYMVALVGLAMAVNALLFGWTLFQLAALLVGLIALAEGSRYALEIRAYRKAA